MKTTTVSAVAVSTALLGIGLLSGCRTSQSMSVLAERSGISVTTSESQPETPGKLLYLQNCSACHGENGYGDGPAAIGFCLPPPDLTRIAERNKGAFPYSKIVAVIEGRRPIDAHGYRQMPVWGDVFQASAKRMGLEDDQELADGNILALASWLERIQTYPIDEN